MYSIKNILKIANFKHIEFIKYYYNKVLIDDFIEVNDKYYKSSNVDIKDSLNLIFDRLKEVDSSYTNIRNLYNMIYKELIRNDIKVSDLFDIYFGKYKPKKYFLTILSFSDFLNISADIMFENNITFASKIDECKCYMMLLELFIMINNKISIEKEQDESIHNVITEVNYKYEEYEDIIKNVIYSFSKNDIDYFGNELINIIRDKNKEKYEIELNNNNKLITKYVYFN